MRERIFALARRIFFTGSFVGVLLEGWLGTVAVLVLAFSVVRQIPSTNIPATFFFLVQAPVFWAALRLKPSQADKAHAMGKELFFAAALRLLVLLSAWLLMDLFGVRALLWQGATGSWLNLPLFTACFITFLLYRLGFWIADQWLMLNRRSLLWTLVNSQLMVVFTLVALYLIGYRIFNYSAAIDKAVPPTLLANIVLDLVRSVIPWIGVSVVMLAAIELVFFPPAFLFSYLTSRRVVRRIQRLEDAIRQAREGDLAVRVEPAGQDEIARLQSEFNDMAAELQRERQRVDDLLRNQRELAAVVSHELRTPITVMRAYLENNLVTRRASLPEDLRSDLDVMHHEVLSLQRLVDDMFTLSRLDAHQLDMDCCWVDVSGVLQAVTKIYRPLAWENKRIDFSMQLPEQPLTAWADAARLEQALGNLAQNAVRHTPAGGVVMLRVETHGEWVEISVQDSGEGIPLQDLPHVWERFYRGGQGSGHGRTGIGLSLVKDVVEAMQGEVGVESLTGEGSRFWLRLRLQQ